MSRRQQSGACAPRSRKPLFVLLAASVFLCLLVVLAEAHDRTQSYSFWQLTEQGARVRVRLAELDLTHFPWGVLAPAERDAEAARYLTAALTLHSAAGTCEALPPVRPVHPGPGRVAYEWEVRCPGTEDLRIRCDILFDIVGSHLHFARVRTLHGRELEKVFHAHERSWSLAPATTAEPQPPSSAAGYVWLGIEHIWSGYDHLAFVIALVLPAFALVPLAKAITGFTVAHSITLTLATLGLVRPHLPSTEALIGLSIALVAIENLWLRAGPRWSGPWWVLILLAAGAAAALAGIGQIPATVFAGTWLFLACHFASLRCGAAYANSRWGIAFLFGLIHGFGFASALAEVGMPSERLALALGAFNLGVELGQMAVVLAIWPLLRALARRSPSWYGTVAESSSAAILALGVFWFVSRAYGS